MVERIPLHSLATSMSNEGNDRTNPSRTTAICAAFSSKTDASVEPLCKSQIIRSSSESGIGTMKNRNNRGKTGRPKGRMP